MALRPKTFAGAAQARQPIGSHFILVKQSRNTNFVHRIRRLCFWGAKVDDGGTESGRNVVKKILARLRTLVSVSEVATAPSRACSAVFPASCFALSFLSGAFGVLSFSGDGAIFQ